MRTLPLYPTTPKAPVDTAPPRARDTACVRCTLSRDAPVVCAGADGTHYRGPGAVMVVTGAPMKRDAFALPVPGAPRDDASNLTPAPLSAPGVVAVRRLILDAVARQYGTTPDAANVVFDWALRCPVPRGAGTTKDRESYARAIDACRPYLANSIRTLRPSRILLLGPVASAVALGDDAPLPINARRGWGWLAQPPGQAAAPLSGRPPTTAQATPAFLLEDALVALATPSMREEYLSDIAWALAATPPPPPWMATAQECYTAEDTAAALDLLRRCAWVSLDLETNGGEMWHPSLRLTSLALTPGPFRPDAVPSADHPALAGLPEAVVRMVLADVDRPGAPEPPGSRASLAFVWSGASTPYQPSEQRAADFPAVLAFLRDPAVGKVGANVKFDLCVLRTLFGDAGEVRNVMLDTRLVGRLVDSESAADLATMAWLVGCGGHKGEAQHALVGAVKALKSRAKSEAAVLPGQLGLFGGGAPAPAQSTPAPPVAYAPELDAPELDASALDAPTFDAPTPGEGDDASAPEDAAPDDAASDDAAPVFDAATELYDPAVGPRPVTGLQPVEDEPGAAIPRGQPTKSAAYALLSGPVLRCYNARDTVTTARLSARLGGILRRRENLGFIWQDVERAATETFARVEARGYPVDIAGLRAAAAKVAAMQRDHRDTIARLAPGVNPASTEQVARFLYGDLGLTPTERTEKGAPATTRSALKALADKHPVVPHLSALSELSHLRSIYLDGDPPEGSAAVGGLLKRVRADGRVHTRYDLAGARTGRLSCVRGDTRVMTACGPVSIEALTTEHAVLTPLGTYEHPSRVFTKGVEAMYRVTAGERAVVCTAEHKLFCRRGWVPLKELVIGDEIRATASDRGPVCGGIPGAQACRGRGPVRVRAVPEGVLDATAHLPGEVRRGVEGAALYARSEVQVRQPAWRTGYTVAGARPCGPANEAESGVVPRSHWPDVWVLGVPRTAEHAVSRHSAREAPDVAVAGTRAQHPLVGAARSGVPGDHGGRGEEPRESRSLLRLGVRGAFGPASTPVVFAGARQVVWSRMAPSGTVPGVLEFEPVRGAHGYRASGRGYSVCAAGGVSAWQGATACGLSTRWSLGTRDRWGVPQATRAARGGSQKGGAGTRARVGHPSRTNHRSHAGYGWCDAEGTHRATWVAITGIEPAGDALVWDMSIPVAASYVAEDLWHHNSGDPNLQNIPRAESELGRIIKDVFVAPPGYTWVQVDFSQLELRVAAWLSEDAEMAALFASGEDFHMKTGELVARVAFGVSTTAWQALSAKERKRFRSYSKAVAFGLLYGKSTPSLARDLGITVEQAESIVSAVLGQFTSLARWSAQALDDTNRTGIAPTWWRGRLARERRVQRMDYRGTVAVNSRVQGTGSTFCLASCVAVDDWLRADGLPAALVGTVHDSLHVLSREDVVDEVVHGTAAIMESWAPDAPIRFVVDAETGPRLGSLDGYAIRRALDGAVAF